MSKAVCLVSGGLDSMVSAALAKEEGYELFFLHVTYGQLTAAREARAFSELADHFRASGKMIATADHLEKMGGSALTDPKIPIPENNIEGPGIPVTYVPFRNAYLLSIAVSWAETIKADTVFIGAVEEDSSGYPDCRESFFSSFQKAVDSGTLPETNIKIRTPLVKMKKKEIILTAARLSAPLGKTWSCYRNQEKACGTCDSCLLRLRGFKEAGLTDPIEYQQKGH